MSKKPTPSKKQCSSSSGSRHGAYVRRQRKNLKNQTVIIPCSNCKKTKRRHFVCGHCGFYKGKKIIHKTKKILDKIQEVAA